ncbi:MAG: Arylsulfatase [Planctomycetota bacterium]
MYWRLPGLLVCGMVWCSVVGVSAAAGKHGAGVRSADRRPNVIFILTDDQGWGDAGFAGHPYIRTPGLDRLAREGTWIRQFYSAASVCSPSRTAYMTGTYPARHQIHGHFATHEQNAARSMPNWLDPQVPNLARLLRQAGYATGHFGKWHLGAGDGAPPPEDYGFDVSKTVNSSGVHLGNEETEPYFRARSTAMIMDEAIEFMRAHRDAPFYLNLWTLLPHARLKPTPEQLEPFAGLEPDAGHAAFGGWMQRYLGRARDLRSQMQVYLASLADLDAQVARLLLAIDELGLSEQTLIVYSSDNGPEDDRVSNASNAGVGSTGPLRARKRSLYEGGIRTPGLVCWPGHVPAGRVDESSVFGAVDFLPTICSLAGVTVPESVRLDGEDQSRNWLGASNPRKGALYWEWLFPVAGSAAEYQPGPLAIRDGEWKLFVNHRGEAAELYCIPEDSGEERDVAKQHPEVVERLRSSVLRWAEGLPASAQRDTFISSGFSRPNSGGTAQKSGAKVDRAAALKRWDKNGDGQLTLDEYSAGLRQADAEERFRRFDQNSDGVLSREEFVGPAGR